MFFILTVTLSCGGSSSENNTYITQASTTSFSTNPCNHKICPCSTSICRIRYDFAVSYITITTLIEEFTLSPKILHSLAIYRAKLTQIHAVWG